MGIATKFGSGGATPTAPDGGAWPPLEGPPGSTDGPDDADVAPDDLELTSLLVKLVDQVKRAVSAAAEQEGLSVAQLDVVRRLLTFGPTPMRRLADSMHCEASNLTGLVDRLEARGLVERRNEVGDRRVRLLALTPAGEQVGYRVWRTVARGAPTRGLPEDRRAALRALLSEALGPGPEVAIPCADAPIGAGRGK